MGKDSITIVVHGGATSIPPEEQEPHRRGCARAAAAGWQVLHSSGSALDAVEAAIRSMEDDATFNAGRGAALTADGTVQLDAGLMDGRSLNVGAVAVVQRYPNPIAIARSLLETSEYHLLAGAGAEAFAAAHGFQAVDNQALVVERERSAFERWRTRQEREASRGAGHDTVGAVARDAQGNLAAGTSTGGLTGTLSGRIGDSPLPGVGFYADNRVGAVACTGDGEGIMRVGLALRTIFELEQGLTAREAASRAMELFQARTPGTAGLIVLDSGGRVGLAHNSQHLAYAFRTAAMAEPETGLTA